MKKATISLAFDQAKLKAVQFYHCTHPPFVGFIVSEKLPHVNDRKKVTCRLL